MTTSRLLHWSVRRELWENRFVLFAPLAVAIIGVVAYAFGIVNHVEQIRGLAALANPKQAHALALPFGMAASAILLTAWIAGLIHAMDALHGERRDRTILFWKSMPVSDRTTVLAKACVPLLVVPVAASVIALAAQLLMLLSTSALLAAGGASAAAPWIAFPLGTHTLIMLYGMAVHALWFAPIFAVFLLVSAWAPRAPFMWIVLPLIAINIVEKVALGTSWLVGAIQYRIVGAMALAFDPSVPRGVINSLSQLEPARFLSSPDPWLGLVVAGLCLAGAIRLRRYREPA